MVDLGKKDINDRNYAKGLQCHKKLWLFHHRKDLSSEITSRAQIVFDDAREVKLLARRRFDGGVEITNKYVDVSGEAEATQQYVKDGHDLIFKAVAIHPIDGCSARINILKRVEDSDEWDMFEAKSSTGMKDKDKDKYIDSMSFQYYVFHSAGYKIRKCFIMILDNSYILDGDINPQQVLKLEDVSSEVSAKQGKINAEVERCGDAGTVLVYNQQFERDRNAELAEDFPEYADALLAINTRMMDLCTPFEKRWLYHPKQNGSASLKAVLPCFTDSSYADLEIRDADKASLEYKKFMAGTISSDDDLDTLWKNLSTYCGQDTFAMVLLLDVLNKEVSNG